MLRQGLKRNVKLLGCAEESVCFLYTDLTNGK